MGSNPHRPASLCPSNINLTNCENSLAMTISVGPWSHTTITCDPHTESLQCHITGFMNRCSLLMPWLLQQGKNTGGQAGGCQQNTQNKGVEWSTHFKVPHKQKQKGDKGHYTHAIISQMCTITTLDLLSCRRNASIPPVDTSGKPTSGLLYKEMVWKCPDSLH